MALLSLEAERGPWKLKIKAELRFVVPESSGFFVPGTKACRLFTVVLCRLKKWLFSLKAERVTTKKRWLLLPLKAAHN